MNNYNAIEYDFMNNIMLYDEIRPIAMVVLDIDVNKEEVKKFIGELLLNDNNNHEKIFCCLEDRYNATIIYNFDNYCMQR